MLTQLKKLLSRKLHDSQATSSQDTLQKTQLASAIILLEAAHADDDCTPAELAHIASTVQSTLNLSADETSELLDQANKTREEEVDLWQFTNHMNGDFSLQEKRDIVENVWEIIFLDGHLDLHEDHFAHKLANLLRLSHKELIEAKMKVKSRTLASS